MARKFDRAWKDAKSDSLRLQVKRICSKSGGVMIDLTSLRGIERNDNPTCEKTVLGLRLAELVF